MELLQDQTGYSSDETDRGYDRPASGATAQPSSLAPLRAENGSASKTLGGDASRLVNQICTPGGLRAQPSREDLRIFVESLGSQSGQHIAELLEDKLVSCLCLIECCLTGKKRLHVMSMLIGPVNVLPGYDSVQLVG